MAKLVCLKAQEELWASTLLVRMLERSRRVFLAVKLGAKKTDFDNLLVHPQMQRHCSMSLGGLRYPMLRTGQPLVDAVEASAANHLSRLTKNMKMKWNKKTKKIQTIGGHDEPLEDAPVSATDRDEPLPSTVNARFVTWEECPRCS